MTYAGNTNSSPERSQEDIKRTLRKYGATSFAQMEELDKAAIMFIVNGITVRISMDLPELEEFKWSNHTPPRERPARDQLKHHDQAIRSKWRSLLLCVKAKLEAVESGISTVEREFLAFMVMPNGQDVGDHLIPQLDAAVKQGKMPKMLALPGGVG